MYLRSNLYLSYHHFDIKQTDRLVACSAFLQTPTTREQNGLQYLSVSSIAGEHLAKDIGNLRVVLLKSVFVARRALVVARFFKRRYWSQMTRALFLVYNLRLCIV